MASAKSANNLVLNPNLPKENLKAFVPTYHTIRSGIIKDISQHYEENDLLEFLDSPFKVCEVRRLNRRIRIEGETKYIPSRTVCLKFAGQILPKYVFLCRNRYEIFPFIPKIKICFSCYRVGHISKACKGKPRCIFCGKDPHDNNDSCPERNNPPKCINCHGEHLASSHDCPMVTKHKTVISLAATENIPLVEARRKITQNNYPPSDPRYDFVNFPTLNTKVSKHSSYQNATSYSTSPSIQTSNQFSVLDSLSSSRTNETVVNGTNIQAEFNRSLSHRNQNGNSKTLSSQKRFQTNNIHPSPPRLLSNTQERQN